MFRFIHTADLQKKGEILSDTNDQTTSIQKCHINIEKIMKTKKFTSLKFSFVQKKAKINLSIAFPTSIQCMLEMI